jgi:type II secretory pathway pseudopilin PulG
MRQPATVGPIAMRNVYTHPMVRAFTLIDILVSLSVVALLISILLPTLSAAQEATRRIVCSSNLRQQGLAMQNYAFGHVDRVPESEFDTHDGQDSAEETIYLRLDRSKRTTLGKATRRGDPTNYNTSNGVVWDGLGRLYNEEYVDHHSCFYCPSHRGAHAEHVYRTHFMDRNPTQHAQSATSEIAGNYQLRLGLARPYLSEINSSVALVADAVRSQEDYNHINGNNLFRADLSVTWFADTTGELWNVLATGDEEDSRVLRKGVRKAWEILDGPSRTVPVVPTE